MDILLSFSQLYYHIIEYVSWISFNICFPTGCRERESKEILLYQEKHISQKKYLKIPFSHKWSWYFSVSWKKDGKQIKYLELGWIRSSTFSDTVSDTVSFQHYIYKLISSNKMYFRFMVKNHIIGFIFIAFSQDLFHWYFLICQILQQILVMLHYLCRYNF